MGLVIMGGRSKQNDTSYPRRPAAPDDNSWRPIDTAPRDELRQAAITIKAHDEWDAARGAAPDATGEKTAEEYVRTMRNEEWRDA